MAKRRTFCITMHLELITANFLRVLEKVMTFSIKLKNDLTVVCCQNYIYILFKHRVIFSTSVTSNKAMYFYVNIEERKSIINFWGRIILSNLHCKFLSVLSYESAYFIASWKWFQTAWVTEYRVRNWQTGRRLGILLSTVILFIRFSL